MTRERFTGRAPWGCPLGRLAARAPPPSLCCPPPGARCTSHIKGAVRSLNAHDHHGRTRIGRLHWMTDCSAPMMGAEQSVILPPSNEISGPSVCGASSTLISPPVVGLQPPRLYGLTSESPACKRSHAAEPSHRQYLGRLKKEQHISTDTQLSKNHFQSLRTSTTHQSLHRKSALVLDLASI